MTHGAAATHLARARDVPDPVTRLVTTDGELYVKRDDLDAPLYGGNKVRKLERLFGDAVARGKRRLVTIGAVGSHQVVATAVYGKREGFEVEAVLVAQPWNPHAEDNIRAALAQGLHPLVASSWAVAPALLGSRLGGDAYLIPLGGSNAVGSLGFVDAAKELAAQIEAGQVPEPDVVVVAMGSGGTAAGLAVGFEEIGLRSRVVGVAISPPIALVSAMARRVARRTAALIGLSREKSARAIARIEVDDRWLGRGYGYPTGEGEIATQRAAIEGLTLDPTYTAKAFACALGRVKAGGERVLYWHTLSAAPMAPLLEGAVPLPPELSRLLR